MYIICILTAYYGNTIDILPLESGNALNDEVVAGERPGLVEAADVHLPSEGNPKRLCAVDAWNREQESSIKNVKTGSTVATV